MKPVYKRILLKLSGEALMGSQNYGIDIAMAQSVAREVKAVHNLGIEVAIVVGGGNIFRGVSKSAGNMDRGSADYIGMLATVMNAVVLQDALEKLDVFTRVMSAIEIPQLAEPFIRRRAIRHLEKKRVVIFAAGTGNPYFATAPSTRNIDLGPFRGTNMRFVSDGQRVAGRAGEGASTLTVTNHRGSIAFLRR